MTYHAQHSIAAFSIAQNPSSEYMLFLSENTYYQTQHILSCAGYSFWN